MFATQSPSTPFRQTGHYTPVRPSPLGPRSSNIATPPWTMSPTRASNQQTPKPSGIEENSFSPVAFPSFSLHTDSQHQHEPQHPPARQHHSSPIFAASAAPATPFFFSPNPASTIKSPASPSPSTRTTKFADRYASQVANPMKSSTGLSRSETRKMFLNKVRNERDEGRFEARGEQMMHADYLADRRRWEESMARDMVAQEPEEMEEDMLPDEAEIRALNDYVSQEEAMERALQENMEHQQDGSFSDDEYDDIFMALPDSALGNQSQDMDMS